MEPDCRITLRTKPKEEATGRFLILALMGGPPFESPQMLGAPSFDFFYRRVGCDEPDPACSRFPVDLLGDGRVADSIPNLEGTGYFILPIADLYDHSAQTIHRRVRDDHSIDGRTPTWSKPSLLGATMDALHIPF